MQKAADWPVPGEPQGRRLSVQFGNRLVRNRPCKFNQTIRWPSTMVNCGMPALIFRLDRTKGQHISSVPGQSTNCFLLCRPNPGRFQRTVLGLQQEGPRPVSAQFDQSSEQTASENGSRLQVLHLRLPGLQVGHQIDSLALLQRSNLFSTHPGSFHFPVRCSYELSATKAAPGSSTYLGA